MSDPCSMCIYEHTGTTGTTGYSVPQTYPGDPSPERTIRLRVESAESGVICRVVYSCILGISHWSSPAAAPA